MTGQSLGAGFVAEQSGAASEAFDTALDQLRDKYEKKAVDDARRAEEARRSAAVGKAGEEEEEEEDDSEWLDDPGVWLGGRWRLGGRPVVGARCVLWRLVLSGGWPLLSLSHPMHAWQVHHSPANLPSPMHALPLSQSWTRFGRRG